MRILFVRYKKSRGVLEGGEQVNQRIHDLLASIVGHDNVTTYYIHDEFKKRSLFDYVKGAVYFPFNYFFGLTPRRVKEIVSMAKDYDVVFIGRSVFGIIAKKLRQARYAGRIVTFFHNVEVPYFKDKMGKLKSMPLMSCVDSNDRYSCRYSDKTIVLNERDDNGIFERYGRRADVRIPIYFKDLYQRETYPDGLTGKRPRCIFLGSYFTPNNEGIVWFAKNVMPHVDASLTIVGKGMARLKNEEPVLADYEVISDAPDLLPWFEQADIMVLPIFKGSGMKVKTCESLMYGKNILGTTEAFQGYNVDYKRVGALCDTAEDFIRAINDFAKNPRPRYNAYSREVFLAKYSEAAVLDKFQQVLG